MDAANADDQLVGSATNDLTFVASSNFSFDLSALNAAFGTANGATLIIDSLAVSKASAECSDAHSRGDAFDAGSTWLELIF